MSDLPLGPSSELQKRFLNVNATVIVYGGSMGSGKSFNGILRHLRFCKDPKYIGYVIRRNKTMLQADGGLFQEACSICRRFCPTVKITSRPMKIRFPWGASISFDGFEDDKAKEFYRGLQLSAVMVDEGTQLKEDHVWMLISRLRSEAKMDGNIWITCNPDPDSYLAKWVDWYLYPKGHEFEGRPDPDKNGKVRWFYRIGETTLWDDTKDGIYSQLLEKYKITDFKDISPLSFVFLGGTIFDNPILIKNNPLYLDNLLNLRRVQKERDLHGRQIAA